MIKLLDIERYVKLNPFAFVPAVAVTACGIFFACFCVHLVCTFCVEKLFLRLFKNRKTVVIDLTESVS